MNGEPREAHEENMANYKELREHVERTRAQLPPPPDGWELDLEFQDWRPDKGHPGYEYVRQQLTDPGDKSGRSGVLDWEQLPANVNRVCIPVLYVDDSNGFSLRDVCLEPRLARKDTEDNGLRAVATQFWVMNRPACVGLFEQGQHVAACVSAKTGQSALHRNIFLRARAAKETEDALDALKVLFTHMSFNEELWRLEKLMDCLSFDLDEHPDVAKLREVLAGQVQHLRGDSAHISPAGIANWYANGSPAAEGLDERYVDAATPTQRLQWLIDESRRLGYKRVAEWGSVNGVSLFPLTKFAPDIAWWGFESSLNARTLGVELAKKCNVPGFNLNPMEDLPTLAPFDAIALFEVLEHNDWEGGKGIVKRLLPNIRPGGSLFVCTPCGNWSIFDDKYCRDLKVRKDHINAFTPSRMAKLLGEVSVETGMALKLCDCRRVENTANIAEANASVFARVEVGP